MINVRLHFSKTFDTKYISHLDLSRCFARALKMSGLNVWYTEGFNPHIFLTFALPLSLGYESICEVVDVRLLDTDTDIDPYIKEKINAGLPYGIEVFDAAPARQKTSDIAWARYIVEIADDAVPADAWGDTARSVMARAEIPAEKKTKKGVGTVDIKPLVHAIDTQTKGALCHMDMVLAAGNERSLNPGLLLDAVFGEQGIRPAHLLVKRVQILDKDMGNFE